MLNKPASGVLALRVGSTYHTVRLASVRAAALPDRLVEHPS
jgi:hypothetical protein